MNECEAVEMSAGCHAVVLFHGLSSTPTELKYLAKGLHKQGYSVHIPVIEGYTQGSSDNQTTHDHALWIKSALQEFDRLVDKYDTISVGGLCIGAVMALHIAARRPNNVSSIMSLSTTLRYDGWAVPMREHFLPLVQFIPPLCKLLVPEMHPYGVKDERLRRFIKNQMEGSGSSMAGASVLRVHDLIQAKKLIKATRARLHDVKAPILLIHAREDEAASPRSAYEVAEHVGSKDIHCVMLTDSYHMISIDQEKNKTLQEMCAFLSTIPSGCMGLHLPQGKTAMAG